MSVEVIIAAFTLISTTVIGIWQIRIAISDKPHSKKRSIAKDTLLKCEYFQREIIPHWW